MSQIAVTDTPFAQVHSFIGTSSVGSAKEQKRRLTGVDWTEHFSLPEIIPNYSTLLSLQICALESHPLQLFDPDQARHFEASHLFLGMTSDLRPHTGCRGRGTLER